jgi:hypothetical protein
MATKLDDLFPIQLTPVQWARLCIIIGSFFIAGGIDYLTAIAKGEIGD